METTTDRRHRGKLRAQERLLLLAQRLAEQPRSDGKAHVRTPELAQILDKAKKLLNARYFDSGASDCPSCGGFGSDTTLYSGAGERWKRDR